MTDTPTGTITKDNHGRWDLNTDLYQKLELTSISHLLTGPFTVETREGSYDLPASWEGRIAFDADGYPYPVEESVFLRTYRAPELTEENPNREEADALLPEQRRRTEALLAARELLVTRVGLFGGSNVQSWTIFDLSGLAEYILTGTRFLLDDDSETGPELRAMQEAYNAGWNDHRSGVLDSAHLKPGSGFDTDAVIWSESHPAAFGRPS